MSEIKFPELADNGQMKIDWVSRNMPILSSIASEFEKSRPFTGIKIALSVHMEAKTAYLCTVLALGGAEMYVTGCNPLSTQDDVVSAIARKGINVYAWHGETEDEYNYHLSSVLECTPDIIIDDGGDLVKLIHEKYSQLIPNIIGGCEETTTGIHRLRAMVALKELRFPMIMVNEAECKYLFDNRYGTGQSVWDGINRTTNLIVAGKTVVIAGYGWCGKGIALRAKGQGARVVITEINPIRALEAVMDGNAVMSMDEAARIGDIFITATGCRDVITERHFLNMNDGAILCNAGHFNVEINLDELRSLSTHPFQARNNIDGYILKNSKKLFVIAQGRLVNLASGDGHPAEIMDMSFSIQALCAEYLVRNRGLLPVDVISVPQDIDNRVAKQKLKTLNIEIDTLTKRQYKYMRK